MVAEAEGPARRAAAELAVRTPAKDAAAAAGWRPEPSLARLSERKLLERVKQASLADAPQPASSKEDTLTAELAAGSPRGSKSHELVSQRHAERSDDCSTSSASEHGKGQPSLAGPSTPRGNGCSDLSQHSRLREGAADDAGEADSHTSLRASAAPEQRQASPPACSLAPEAAEQCGSRSPSAAAKPSAEPSDGSAKRQRPAELQAEERLVLRVKLETPQQQQQQPPQPALPGSKAAVTAERVVSVHVRAAEECKLLPPQQPQQQQEPEADPGGRARAVQGAYCELDDSDGSPIPRKVQRKPRSKPARRAPAQPLRRPPRAAAFAEAPGDGEYLPPGADIADQAGGSLPVAVCKRPRATRSQSATLPRTALASAGSGAQRGGRQLRWSGSGSGGSSSLLGSPMSARRLRSQPLDLSCLQPDAFACEAPLPKRPKHSALAAGLAQLRGVEQAAVVPLARSSSGGAKPRPAWSARQAELAAALAADAAAAASRHSADMRLLDCPPRREAWQALPDRLGGSPLGKALAAAATQQQREQPQQQLEGEGALALCRALMPQCLGSAAAAWRERLAAPCAGALGEPSTHARARQERDLQSTWDDLLARHAQEQGVLESCAQAWGPGADA